MALGLAIDCRSMSPEALGSLCTAETGGLITGFLRHVSLLPATNIGMLLGGLVALGLGRSTNPSAAAMTLACNALMLVGMTLAACLGPVFVTRFGLDWNAGVMLAVMTGGMTLGMAAAAAIDRLRNFTPTPTRPHQGGGGIWRMACGIAWMSVRLFPNQWPDRRASPVDSDTQSIPAPLMGAG